MKISEIIKKKVVEIRGVKITVSPNMPWQDYVEGTKIADVEERGIYIISRSIESWNIEGEDGKPLPITTDVIKALPVWIMQPVMEAMAELQEVQEKKKMSSSKK
jgi:hypothetical protein